VLMGIDWRLNVLTYVFVDIIFLFGFDFRAVCILKKGY
jgi:hypothetical protein